MCPGPCGPVRILRHGVSTSRTPSCSSSTCVPFIAHPPSSSSRGVCSWKRWKRLSLTARSPFFPNQWTSPNLTVSWHWLLRVERATDDVTRTEPITARSIHLIVLRRRASAAEGGGLRGLGRPVGAEGLPLLVAVSAGAEAAGDLDLAQVSGDSPGWLTINLAETVEAVTAASRHAVQKRAKQIIHHPTSYL